MITIAKTKELLGNVKLSDKQAQEIRDDLYDLAEIALESWQEKLQNQKEINSQNQ